MTVHIRFLFKALDLDHTLASDRTPNQINDCIDRQRSALEAEYGLMGLKVFLRVQTPLGGQEYLRVESDRGARVVAEARQRLVVQFFHAKRIEGVQARMLGVNEQLRRREKDLKTLMSQLKDESSLFYVKGIISKTSKRSFSDLQDVVDISIAVSQPLVDCSKGYPYPLFCEQVDVCSHIQRLRRASNAECSLHVRACRQQASPSVLKQLLASNQLQKGKALCIVELFTRVEQVEGKIMVSLEGQGGEQVWEEAGELLKDSQIDLLIVIGVGVHLLAEIPYNRPLILLTSFSVQENRVGDTSYNRDRFAIVFLEQLFQGIFRRLPLGESFSAARKEVRGHLENSLWCCCLHKHAEDCRWSQVVRRVGSQQAHRLFRHSADEWKADKFYPVLTFLQQMILGSSHNLCAEGNYCCYERMGASKIQLHKDADSINKLLFWNGEEYPCDQGILSSKLNKFEGEACDRPLLRTRPLALYSLLQLISSNKLAVLRASDLSLARRLLAQGLDYLRSRDPVVHLCELEMEKEMNVEKELMSYLQALTPKAGNSLKLLVAIVEREGGKGDPVYQSFLQDPGSFLNNARRIHRVDVAVRFLVVTNNPSFHGEYPTLHLGADPHPDEKYFQILHGYRGEQVSPEILNALREQIQQGAANNRQGVTEKCKNLRNDDPEAFTFLSFLALFGEDGLYLTKSTTPILHKLFPVEVVRRAIGRQLPVESSIFPNCAYLQLGKAYREELGECEAASLKRLEYYNLLLRLYAHFLKTKPTSFLEGFLGKQGIFCISIEPQDNRFSLLLEEFNKMRDVGDAFYNHSTFKTIYHINQIQKIIKQALKRKQRPRQFQPVRVCSLSPQEVAPSVLLWSIVQKLCLLMYALRKKFEERMRQTQALLTILLLKGEVRHTLVEVGRVQLSLLLEQRPQKLADGVAHEKLSSFITFLHLYSLRLSALACASPHKFRQALYNCFTLLYKLKQSCENAQVRGEFARHRLSAVVGESVWYRQLLRLIQRKALFQFRLIRTTGAQREENQDYRKMVNMGEIRYQFQNLYMRLPEAERKESDLLLMDHYIRISLNQTKADNSLLFAIRTSISPQLQPIYQHLCLKVDKKTLFRGKRLVLMGRARNSFVEGQPYIFNRKRYLTVPYLTRLLEGTALKSSYFNLTSTTIHHLSQAGPNEILHLLLSLDGDGQNLLIGSESSVESVSMPVGELAHQLLRLNIKVMLLMGRCAIAACSKIKKFYEVQLKSAPFIIAIESTDFSMNDCSLHKYPPTSPNYAWKYLQNQVYLMALDFVALAVVQKINSLLRHAQTLFTLDSVNKIVEESMKTARRILSLKFQCVDEALGTLRWQVWGTTQTIAKIEEGSFEDLTSKFYSSEHNFYHYKYYENVGRCQEISSILSALKRKPVIQVMGGPKTGKTTILQEVSWTAQIKNFFQLGISIFDAAVSLDELKEFIMSRKFKERAEGAHAEPTLLMAVDNLDINTLEQQRQIFQKLRNRAVTLLFASEDREVEGRVRKLMGCGEALRVDLNRVQLEDVFGLLLSSLKGLGIQLDPEEKYTFQIVKQFEQKITATMSEVEKVQEGRIGMAIRSLDEKVTTQARHETYYNFYRQNYDLLVKKLREKNQLQLKIV